MRVPVAYPSRASRSTDSTAAALPVPTNTERAIPARSLRAFGSGGGGGPPPTNASISVSWGSTPAPYGNWMDITFTNFPVGPVAWDCVEEGVSYGPYQTTLSSSTETLTSNTCYDTEAGGSDYVTADGISSNTIATDPAQPTQETYAEATGYGPVKTWSNPNGPSGTEGPTLGANTVYQVTCRVSATPEGQPRTRGGTRRHPASMVPQMPSVTKALPHARAALPALRWSTILSRSAKSLLGRQSESEVTTGVPSSCWAH